MTRTTLVLFSIALLLTVPCKAVTVGQYILTDLGDLPGGTDESYATGINSHGQVVGWSGTDQVTRGFLWSPNSPNSPTGSLTDIGSLRPDGQSYAYGINAQGQVVGRTSGNPLNEAFLWTPTTPNSNAGSMTTIIGGPFQEGFSYAYGLNDSGKVVGYGQTTDGFRGFMWTPDAPNGSVGSVQSLEPSPVAFNINSNGEVVGRGIQAEGTTNGFVWIPNVPNGTAGSLVLLKNPPTIYGRFGTGAIAINRYGQIVGGSGVVLLDNKGNATFTSHAAMWIANASNITEFSEVDLGTVNGLPSSAGAINSQGQVVGEFGYEQSSRAFMWTPNTPNATSGAMIDLNQLLGPAEQSKWTLGQAIGINDVGQIIGNAMYDPDGPGGEPAVPRAFLLTPVPEPASIALIALSTAIIAGSCPSRSRRP